MTSNFDCIVVGAGVAGMTAAIYLKRAGRSVLLLEKSAPGGQINMSPSVENYPGFLKIDGATLALNIFEQTQNLNINYKYGNVLKISEYNNQFKITTDLEEITSKSVIIATGRQVKKLNLEFEESLIGKGISYCALCDANFYKDDIVAIVGSNSKTVEEAIYLSNICNKIFLVCEYEQINAEKILIDRINKISNIIIYYNSKPKKLIIEDNKLQGILVEKNNKDEQLICHGIFVSNGMIPQLEFESELLHENNYIVVDNNMKTNIKGIFACGDIIKKDIYQLSTAVGEAAIAATKVDEYLSMGE